MNKLALAVAFSASHRTRSPTAAPMRPLSSKKLRGLSRPDGAGQTPARKSMKVRDLRSAEVQQQSDGDFTRAIAEVRGRCRRTRAS
jgi:hypothetical protein